MNDFFTEHLIKRKKSFAETILIVAIILLAAVLSYFSFFLILSIRLIAQFALAAVAAICWAAYLIISSRNIEYEYIVTNGELDIDKIISKRKRTRVISLKSKDFEQIVPISEFKGGNFTKEIDVSDNDKNSQVYVLLSSVDGTRTKIIFNPTRKMLRIFKRFNPGAVSGDFED